MNPVAGPSQALALAERPSFRVLDALELTTLTKRTPTLDGAVPLRAAQGCLPLLEGNAMGQQVTLRSPVALHSTWRKIRAFAEDGPELERRVRAAALRLAAQRFLEPDGAWYKRLSQGQLAWREGDSLHFWTGLLVRPRPGVWLKVGGCANRRNRRFGVREFCVADSARYTPLVLALDVARDRKLVLQGEIACVAAINPGLDIEECTLEEGADLLRSHVDFYDAKYFAEKKLGVTRKYRRLAASEPSARDPASPPARLLQMGLSTVDIDPGPPFLGPERTHFEPQSPDGRRAPRLSMKNAVGFSATFDGMSLEIRRDERELGAYARAVRGAFEQVLGPSGSDEHRGALLYLTKYFTPHPPGDPHFFVKPAALFRTPPGWVTVVDGISGDGYDVLRGVVATDRYHALPAVFSIWKDGPVEVESNTPIAMAFATKKELLESRWEREPWLDT